MTIVVTAIGWILGSLWFLRCLFQIEIKANGKIKHDDIFWAVVMSVLAWWFFGWVFIFDAVRHRMAKRDLTATIRKVFRI